MAAALLLPISVKCAVFENGKVWLRKNERDEWELPGGKLEENEQPDQTAMREAKEELGVKVKVGNLIGANLYKIPVSNDKEVRVFVIAYRCDFVERVGDVEQAGEAGAAEFRAFSMKEVESLNMPEFYRGWAKNAI